MPGVMRVDGITVLKPFSILGVKCGAEASPCEETSDTCPQVIAERCERVIGMLRLD